MVLVLKQGSRNMEGVYLKSPENKNVSKMTVNFHDSVLDIVPEHIFTSYDSNYNVVKKKETVKKGKKTQAIG